MMSASYQQLFACLTHNLDLFVDMVKNKKLTLMATDQWTVKDVLCHIVFWHETYAKNYYALAHKLPPVIPSTSMNILNLEGVAALRKYSTATLVKRLRAAHNTLYDCIVVHKVPKMTYKQGGRVYTTSDFLKVVAGHLTTHTKHVRRAK